MADFSDGYFSMISQPLNQTVTVTSPNGGETWEKGSYSTVNWSSENISSQLDIQLYKSNDLVYTLALRQMMVIRTFMCQIIGMSQVYIK